jgi:MoaA/NifB/PqqE/SkfB family radical SAM enzyme
VELALQVTNECPYRCIHCPRTYERAGRKSSEFIDPAFLKKLDKCMNTFTRILMVGDGEPLHHPNFPEILDFCLKSGAEVSLSTNGDEITPAIARRMAEGGLTHIQFSVDAASAELYERIRVGSRLEKVTRNLTRLAGLRDRYKRQKPFISVACVLMRQNRDEASGLVRLAASCGADQVLFIPLAVPPGPPQVREFFRYESLSLEAHREALASARAEADRLGIEVASPEIDGFLSQGEEGIRAWQERTACAPTSTLSSEYARWAAKETVRQPPPSPGAIPAETAIAEEPAPEKSLICTQPWTTCFLQRDGRVSPCTINPIGLDTLKNHDSLNDLWNAPTFRKLRVALSAGQKDPYCKPCHERLQGRDVVEEFVHVAIPETAVPAPEPLIEKEFDDPDAPVLGLGFSSKGTSLALASGGGKLGFRPAVALCGILPCRFISRHVSPDFSGEFYLDEGILNEMVQALEGAGLAEGKKIKYLAYNLDPVLVGYGEAPRCPELENLFPEAIPLSLPAHLGALALAFYSSSFKEAALLIVQSADLYQNGTESAVVLGKGTGRNLEILNRLHHRHNPGVLYAALRQYLGLESWEEGRIARMAEKGAPRLVETFRQEITVAEGHKFCFRKGGFLAALADACMDIAQPMDPAAILDSQFGPPLTPGEPAAAHHIDVAFAMHRIAGDLWVHLAHQAYENTKLDRLCLGGTWCVDEAIKQRILDKTPFKELHAPPEWAGPGLAAGNALYAAVKNLGAARPRSEDVVAALSPQEVEAPPPQEVSRYRKKALITLRRQHERLARAQQALEGDAPANASSVLHLLVRQNQNLLNRHIEERREIELLRDRLTFFGAVKSLLRKVKGRLKGKPGKRA